MFDITFEEQTAFDAGYDTHQAGFGQGACPYDPETQKLLWEAWQEGWYLAYGDPIGSAEFDAAFDAAQEDVLWNT